MRSSRTDEAYANGLCIFMPPVIVLPTVYIYTARTLECPEKREAPAVGPGPLSRKTDDDSPSVSRASLVLYLWLRLEGALPLLPPPSRDSYSDDRDSWDISAALSYRTSDGVKSRNHAFAQLQKDWLVPTSLWFVSGQGRYDFDEFRAWRHRASGTGTVGYQIVDNDVWTMRGQAGLGAKRTFGSDDERFAPEAVATVEGSWNINASQTFNTATTVLPDLHQTGRFRTMTSADWIIKIDHADGLSFKLGLANEYESQTHGQAKHNDLRYYGNLVLDF